jgi:hypothetical protein
MNVMDMLKDAAAEIRAIECDPREMLVAEMNGVVESRIKGCGLGDEAKAEIVRSVLSELLDNARRYVPSGDFKRLNEAVVTADVAMLTLIKERHAVIREANSFPAQIKSNLAALSEHAYGRAETLALEEVCTDGDQIVDVMFDAVTIERGGARRTITRADLINATQPMNSSFESWKKSGGFISDKEIASRRAVAERRDYNEAHPDSGRSIVSPTGEVSRA